MSYMAKGPPTKEQAPNAGSERPIGQAPAVGNQSMASPQIDANNAFQTQQQLLSTIQQQLYMQQAAQASQVLAAQSWSSLTQQQTTTTVSSNVPPLVPQIHQNQGNAALYPVQQQAPQQQQTPNITISRVPAPPISVHQQTPSTTTAVTTTTNQANAGTAQIPITQSLAPTTAGPVVIGQNTQNNSSGIPVQSPAKSVSAVLSQSSPPPAVTQTKVAPISNNVTKPPALAPISQTPPKPQTQIQSSPGSKAVAAESPNKNLGVSPVAKPVTPVKETASPVLPVRPISHQNPSSISIVQKTPTKSTFKLATVTPRIKTTPKKSPPAPVAAPPQRSPVVSSPVSSNTTATTPGLDRPNALIKSKESPKPVTSPAKVEQKVPTPVKTPEVAKVNSASATNNVNIPASTVQTNNTSVTPPQKKEEPKITLPKDPVKTETAKKEVAEVPKAKETPVTPPKPEKEKPQEPEKPSKEVKEKVVPPQPNKVPLEKKETTAVVQVKPDTNKKDVKPQTPARTKQPKTIQTPQNTPTTTQNTKLEKTEPKPSTSQGPDGSTGRTRRARKGVQPFQSPIPEIENAKKASINQGASTSKEPTEKLIIFYKNEFLAVRNADDGFYICRVTTNVTKKGQSINIRWYNEEDPGSGIYIPDYFDKTQFECVLTTVELEKSNKSSYKIPDGELKRVQHILKNALDVEKGIVPKPEITEENPDGLDLSLYTSETQLERSEVSTPKSKTSATGNKKSTAKKSLKRSRDESDDEDDNDSDYVVLAKTAKTTAVSQPARERTQRTPATATPATASKKRKAPEPAKAPPAKKAAQEKAPVRSAKGKGDATPAKTPVEPPKSQKKAPEVPATNKSATKTTPATTTTKKVTQVATARPTRASRK